MSIDNEIKYASIDELFLDPKNPRLGRYVTAENLPQDDLLRRMEEWAIDEIAVSFLISDGFWIQEALIVVKEELYGKECFVVVEGNRRLAALKLLKLAYAGEQVSRRWKTLVEQYPKHPEGLFDDVPYLVAESREDIEAYLGFRHVTGVKEWATAEKAEFISKLIEQGMNYEQVRRKIGSRLATVRQNYIGYRLLRQLEEQVESFDPNMSSVQNRFSVMYLSLRSEGPQRYLQIDVDNMPETTLYPVEKDHLRRLENFARWIFGTQTVQPLFSDSRQIGQFSKMLLSDEALEYLETTEDASFDIAYQIAGGDRVELVDNLRSAATLVKSTLGDVHLHTDDDEVQKYVMLLGRHLVQVLNAFPSIRDELFPIAHK